jgi:stress response protein YsnF
LTRYVETETVTRTIEVRHEQVRVEYQPVLAAGELERPAAGSAAGGGGWVVLYDEEVVLTTRRVPRERVRLRTHTVTEDREITERLRKEQIEVTDPRRHG